MNIFERLHKKAKEIAVVNAEAHYHPLSLDEFEEPAKWKYSYQGTPVDELTVNQQIQIILDELEKSERKVKALIGNFDMRNNSKGLYEDEIEGNQGGWIMPHTKLN